jgi:hypothetical protein
LSVFWGKKTIAIDLFQGIGMLWQLLGLDMSEQRRDTTARDIIGKAARAIPESLMPSGLAD